MKSNPEIRAAWLAQLLSTEAADRPGAESAVRRLYAAAGFAEPRHVLWFDSPYEASWAVALLAAPYNQMWQDRFSSRGAGMWWPFENVAVISERPTEVHVNDAKLLHRGDGPAVVFRDGRTAYAWNGRAVPERWIMQPETVPAREYKSFDPTFTKHVAARIGQSTEKAKKRAKPASILKAVLPPDPVARLEQLRSHARSAIGDDALRLRFEAAHTARVIGAESDRRFREGCRSDSIVASRVL